MVIDKNEIIRQLDLCYLSYRSARNLRRQLAESKSSFRSFTNGIRLLKINMEDSRKIFYIFRGTRNLKNIYYDAKYIKEFDTRLDINLHKGFCQCANNIQKQIEKELFLESETNEVVFGGHSLGAAIALILFLKMKDQLNLKSIITFGQPKITDIAGSQKFKDIHLLRVTNRYDPVPLLPSLLVHKENRDFKHFGDELVLWPGTRFSYFDKTKITEFHLDEFWEFKRKKRLLDHFMTSYTKNVLLKRMGTWHSL